MYRLSDLDARIDRLWSRIDTRRQTLRLAVSATPPMRRPEPFARAVRQRFEPFPVPGDWGPAWSTTWFRVQGAVPADWGPDDSEVVLDLGFRGGGPGFECEGLAHASDGSVIKGVEPRNRHIPLARAAPDGQTVDFYVEAAANPVIPGPTGGPMVWGSPDTAPVRPLYRLAEASLVRVDLEARELLADLEALWELQAELGAGSPRREAIRRDVARAADLFDAWPGARGVGAARAALVPSLARPACASAHLVTAVGHAHIDSAWLWPVRETARKCARTFSNVVALAEQRPDLRFAASSAQQYAWLKERYPDLFGRVKELVAAGVIVPVGAMWVECDTLMPSGESLARQFALGKRFFREEFGVEPAEVWLPDCFGYSGALPQLARLAGMRWMMSQKLSWNQTNHFPHHTFWWEGIDGSRLFTHFPPCDNYSTKLSGEQLAHAVRNFADLGPANRSLMPFGYGDGGGGPTREMLWKADRLADLEGSPRVSIGSPAEFFEAAAAEYPNAPVWRGELYLELHRGTLTSHHALKAGNRRVEGLLHEAELWCAQASIRAGADHPYGELAAIWRRAALLQFHDILPGSSIAWVNAEARGDYAELSGRLEDLIGDALATLAGPDPAPAVWNATAEPWSGAPAGGAAPTPGQRPAGEPGPMPRAQPSADGGFRLDNARLAVLVAPDGAVRSVWDAERGREVLAGDGNVLVVHPDHPARFDAWDIDEHYRASAREIRQTIAPPVALTDADGRVGVQVERRSGASSYIQRIWLAAGVKRVDFELAVDWRERETLLKTGFELAVAAQWSSAETQFGHVRRPTHANTSWDAARFEVAAHRWLHVGEPGYGVALVNDSIYGHEVTRPGPGWEGQPQTTVRLSLLRAPLYPDPETDQGQHTFRYALVADAAIADAVREGARANLPLRRAPGPAGGLAPLVEVTGAGLLETVKLADDRSGDVIARLYEPLGARGAARVAFGFPACEVRAVDLLEEALPEGFGRPGPRPDGEAWVVALNPFEVVTLRARRSSQAASHQPVRPPTAQAAAAARP
ncbi:MAG: glycosyl hydrolase-related protein [Bifidobacteriaceae bacterium]|jgi:alpha-mannosidase|nr:glycosyl hydrolase-related protein [Bifidobacteriaceae bacterium]